MPKPSRRPKRGQTSDGEYESRQRMSWIDEGGIDLRAARANLLEFIAGLYEDALKLMQAPEPAAATATRRPRAIKSAPKRAKAPPRRKKPLARVKKKPVPPRQKRKLPPPRKKKKAPIRVKSRKKRK